MTQPSGRCLGCADGIVVKDHHCARDKELVPHGGFCACPRPGCGPSGKRTVVASPGVEPGRPPL